jgi:hypothetical protein
MQLSHSKQADVHIPQLPDIVGLGGAVAGLLAGLAMIGVSPLLSLLTGIGIWEPPKLIAATVYGPEVIDTPGFVLLPVVTGTLLHLLTATPVRQSLWHPSPPRAAPDDGFRPADLPGACLWNALFFCGLLYHLARGQPDASRLVHGPGHCPASGVWDGPRPFLHGCPTAALHRVMAQEDHDVACW